MRHYIFRPFDNLWLSTAWTWTNDFQDAMVITEETTALQYVTELTNPLFKIYVMMRRTD